MTLSRYATTAAIRVNSRDGQNVIRILKSQVGLSAKLRKGIREGKIDNITTELAEGQRLDHLAGQYYNDSTLWWIIAAANGIGYAPQISYGTELIIPTNIDQIVSVLF